MLREDAEYDAALARNARRIWRHALVLCLAMVTFATHWPSFGADVYMHVDKSLHFICFGALAWCFLNASPCRRPIFNLALALAWVYIDEASQLIEGFGRSFSWYDIVAGWIGCVVAGLLWWALRLRAPAASKERLNDLTAERLLYSNKAEWLRAAAITAACAALIPAATLAQGELANSGPLAPLVYPTALGGLVGVVLATALGLLRARAQLAMNGGITGATTLGAASSTAMSSMVRSLMLPLLVGGSLFVPTVSLVAGAERVLFGGVTGGAARVDAEGFLVLRPLLATTLTLTAVVATSGILARWHRATR